MTKGEDSPSEMAHARQSDGIKVIFDKKSPASSRSPSRSSGGRGRHAGRRSNRGRYRSSSCSSTSSSSRSRSASHSKSRSHPRCHRGSSRCGCDRHRRYGRGYRAHRRSDSRSPSPERYSRRRRSRSSRRRSRKAGSRFNSKFSQSPSRTNRSRSRSRSSGHSVSLRLDDKRELLKAAVANAIEILGVEKLEVPESVKPVLPEQSEFKRASPEPETSWVRVRQDPEKSLSQSSEVESDDDMSSPKMSPKRKIISFSINNSVVKPVVAAPSGAKVTPRVDSYEARKPYGHWVPVKSGRTSKAHKRTLAMLH